MAPMQRSGDRPSGRAGSVTHPAQMIQSRNTQHSLYGTGVLADPPASQNTAALTHQEILRARNASAAYTPIRNPGHLQSAQQAMLDMPLSNMTPPSASAVTPSSITSQIYGRLSQPYSSSMPSYPNHRQNVSHTPPVGIASMTTPEVSTGPYNGQIMPARPVTSGVPGGEGSAMEQIAAQRTAEQEWAILAQQRQAEQQALETRHLARAMADSLQENEARKSLEVPLKDRELHEITSQFADSTILKGVWPLFYCFMHAMSIHSQNQCYCSWSC